LECAKHALEEEVIRLLTGPGSEERRKYLHDSGALYTNDPEELGRYIEATFLTYQSLTPEQEQTSEGREKYEELANLLGISGIAMPITFRDWKVDRVLEAEQKWGLHSGGIAQLEKQLCTYYSSDRSSKPVHLHKGPGNGELMQHLRSVSNCMEEVGVGDRLYFSIESLLRRHLKPEMEQDSTAEGVVFILGQALQAAVHKKWFKPIRDKNNVVRRWELNVQHCDLNEIFSLLAKPKEWLPDVYRKMMSDLYKASVEFEDDKDEHLAPSAQEVLVKLAGSERDYCYARSQRLQVLCNNVSETRASFEQGNLTEEQMFEQLIAHMERYTLITGKSVPNNSSVDLLDTTDAFIACLDAEIVNLRTLASGTNELSQEEVRNLQELSEQKKNVSNTVAKLSVLLQQCAKYPDRDGVPQEVREGLALLPKYTTENLSHLSSCGACKEWMQQCMKDLIEQSRRIKEDIGALKNKKNAKQAFASLEEEVAADLSAFFSEDFVEAVRNHALYESEGYRKQGVSMDLNKSGPSMHIRNFVPGFFTEKLKEFPSESCLLITSSRGDSHERSSPMERQQGWTLHLKNEPGDFEKDIALSIENLAPGGVHLTDGHRQSFTRIDRFEEIMRVAGARSDVLVRLIMDSKTHEPRSVFIQKQHPSGYLPDEDIGSFLEEDGCYITSLEKVMRLRPDLFLHRVMRRQIDDLAGGSTQAFKDCQQHIGEDIQRCLRRIATGKLARYMDLVDFSLLELTRERVYKTLTGSGLSDEMHGIHVGMPLQNTGDNADIEATTGFYDLRDVLLQRCGVEKEAPREVHHLYERELFRTLAARAHGLVMAQQITDTPLEEGHLEEWKQYAFLEAKNVGLGGEMIISSADINAAVTRVAEDLRERIQPLLGKDEDVTIGRGGLELFDAGKIHLAPKRNVPFESLINAHIALPIGALPTNVEFNKPDMQQLLNGKAEQIRSILLRMKEGTGQAPIKLILFQDCGVNTCLGAALGKLLGNDVYQECVSCLNIFFNEEKGIGPLGRDFENNGKRRMEEYCRSGSLFVVGGSWFNPDDDFGKFFREHYGVLIDGAIAPSNARSRALFICFGYQTQANVIGQKHRDRLPNLEAGPGALEFCPIPVLQEVTRHPVFQDCPSTVTLMTTHGRLVKGLHDIPQGMESIIRPIARSRLSGLSTMSEFYQGRGYGIQPHPEVNIVRPDTDTKSVSDREAIMHEVEKYRKFLVDIYGIKPECLDRMWREAEQHVQGNAGLHILANAILDLLKGMPRQGKTKKHRKASS